MADLSDFLNDEIAGDVAASTGVPDPVPPADYELQLSSSELAPTKDNTGAMLKCQFEVISGQYEGRKIFAQFNIKNKSQQAQTIGIGEFKALCLATGVPFEEARADTSVLEYKPFRAKVGFEKETTNQATGLPYPPRNSIKKYYPQGEEAAPASTGAGPTQAPAKVAPHVAAQANKPAASGGGKLPWQK